MRYDNTKIQKYICETQYVAEFVRLLLQTPNTMWQSTLFARRTGRTQPPRLLCLPLVQSDVGIARLIRRGAEIPCLAPQLFPHNPKGYGASFISLSSEAP